MEACLLGTKAGSRLTNHASSVLACGTASASGMPAITRTSPFIGLPLQRTAAFKKVSSHSASDHNRQVAPVRASDSAAAKKVFQSYSSYAVPLDNQSPLENQAMSSFNTRSLAEILRDMNKRVPDKVLKVHLFEGVPLKYIPWYYANRMLSFYAPGWSGEVRNITFSADSKTASVVYRVTIRGSDGEAWREASGTARLDNGLTGDPVQKAEGVAFCRACARFGLGLYLYHEDEVA